MTKREQRVERIPVGGPRSILSVPNLDPNYAYRWVRDDMGRIDMFKQGGYEVVVRDHVVGEPAVDSGTRLASAYTQTRGTSTLVLMRIPKEWYEADQKAKQDEIDALEATMKADAHKVNDYGSLTIQRKAGKK